MSIVDRIMARLRKSEMLRVSVSSGMIVMVRLLGTAATFIYTLIMARMMSPHDFGLVWAIWSGSFIAANLATLNLGAVAVREIVKAKTAGNDAQAAGFVSFCRLVLLFISPLVMLGFIGLAGWLDPAQVSQNLWAYCFAAVAIPIMGWTQTNSAVAAALHLPFLAQAPRSLVRPILFLLVLGLLWLGDYNINVAQVIGLYLLAVTLAGVIQYLLVAHVFDFMRTAAPDRTNWKAWVANGFMLLPTRLMSDQLKNLLIIASSLSIGAVGVAHLNIALSIINILNFSITAVEMGFSARTSAALVRGNRWRATQFLAISGLLKTLPLLVGSVLLFAFAEPLVGLFGEGYADGAIAALWFLLIPASKAFFGNSALVLQVMNRQKVIMWTSLATLIAIPLAAFAVAAQANTQANLTISAAIAFSAVLVAQQAGSWAVCLQLTGIDTSMPGAVVKWLRAKKPDGPA